MRGLSLIGLLIGLGIAGALMLNQLKSASQDGEILPTEAIDKAEEAADAVTQSNETQNEIERVEQVENLEQDLQAPSQE